MITGSCSDQTCFFLFGFGHAVQACRIFSPPNRDPTGFPVLEARSLNFWTARSPLHF